MVKIDKSKCIGCGQCVNDCISGNLKLTEGKARFGESCLLCGHCVAICPADAVSIPEYEMADVISYDKDGMAFDIETFLYTVKFRRSIRHYTKQSVSREKLENIVQAGRYTATGANRQACRFIVVQDNLDILKDLIWNGIDEVTKKPDALPAEMVTALKNFTDMRADGTDYLFRNAPVVVYIAAESTVDAALAAQNMEMAAIAQGLGMLYNGYLARVTDANEKAIEWLDAGEKPIAVCMLLGYPEKSYQRTAPRRTADVRWR